MHIYTDKNKTTYVISFTGGVNKVISPNLLSENIQFKNYDKNDGLASDLALSMIEDAQNQLWVVSEIALSKFNPVKETFENYELSSIYQSSTSPKLFLLSMPAIKLCWELTKVF